MAKVGLSVECVTYLSFYVCVELTVVVTCFVSWAVGVDGTLWSTVGRRTHISLITSEHTINN